MIGMAPSLIRRASSSAEPVLALAWRMAAYMASSFRLVVVMGGTLRQAARLGHLLLIQMSKSFRCHAPPLAGHPVFQRRLGKAQASLEKLDRPVKPGDDSGGGT